MSRKISVPKDKRPQAIEQLLRDFRRDNPGKWMAWNDVLDVVGGSERDFSRMMRTAKEKILAHEAVVATAPDVPEEMKEEFDRFLVGMWKRSCDLSDVSASELRRARQIDRDAMDQERAEHDAMVSVLVAERDAWREQAENSDAKVVEMAERLSDTRGELRDAQAALAAMRDLFTNLTGSSPDTGGSGEGNASGDGTTSGRKTGTRRSSKSSKETSDDKQKPDDPSSPELPMS